MAGWSWISSLWREKKAAAVRAADKMRSKSAMGEDYKRAKARKKRK